MQKYERNADQTDAKQIEAAAIFLQRMLPLLIAGKTFEQAGAAVLKRDKELMNAALEQTETGAHIRNELASSIYRAVRSTK